MKKQGASRITGVMLSGWPGGIVGELGLLNNLMFLHMLVLECSLHFARLAIGGVVRLPLLLIMYFSGRWVYAALHSSRPHHELLDPRQAARKDFPLSHEPHLYFPYQVHASWCAFLST